MKQINYFKFLEKYPEFIDIDDDLSVKLVLLKHIRKKYWRKKKGEVARLLPIKHLGNHPNLIDRFYRIKYRNCIVATIFRQDDKIVKSWVQMSRSDIYQMMEKEEITNLKRVILMEDMLK